MPDRPLISMVLIARDEAHNVEPCFATFWEHVDEVVLCDTGSVDDTVAVARRFAQQRGEPEKLKVGHFEWCDDFAAARNYADSLATGEWLSWSDLDDRVVGAEHLRALVESDPSSSVFMAQWWVGGRVWGEKEGRAWSRERLVRRGMFPWYGKCNEQRRIPPPDELVHVSPTVVRWEHPTWGKITNPYYVRLWQEMVAEDPRDWVPLMYLVLGALHDGDRVRVMQLAGDYVKVPEGAARVRRSFWRVTVEQMLAADKPELALGIARVAHLEDPESSVAFTSLAECHHNLGQLERAIDCAEEALRRGPDAVVDQLVSPLIHAWLPATIKSTALRELGDLAAALDAARHAQAIVAESGESPGRSILMEASDALVADLESEMLECV